MSHAPATNNARYLDAAELARTESVWESEYSSTHFPRLQDIAVSDVPQLLARLRFAQWSGHAAVHGQMTGSVELVCQRCMRAMCYPFDESFDLVMIEAGEESLETPDSYEIVCLDPTRLDVQWLLEEQLLLALPLIPKHEDEAECVISADSGAEPNSEPVEGPVATDRQRPFQNLRDLLRKE